MRGPAHFFGKRPGGKRRRPAGVPARAASSCPAPRRTLPCGSAPAADPPVPRNAPSLCKYSSYGRLAISPLLHDAFDCIFRTYEQAKRESICIVLPYSDHWFPSRGGRSSIARIFAHGRSRTGKAAGARRERGRSWARSLPEVLSFDKQARSRRRDQGAQA